MTDNEGGSIQKRNDYKLLGITVILFALCIYDANWGMFAGLFGIPTAFILWVKRLRDKQKRTAQMRFVTYGSLLLLTVSGPAGCAYVHQKAEATAAPAIQKVVQYHQENGKYPAGLNVVGYTEPLKCPNGMKYGYSVSDEGDRFVMTCVTFGFNKHSYFSDKRQWINWD
jgi:hypothetical protein